MPQVTVTIAGKTYRMACGEGEAGHLEGLAQAFDAKIDELRGAFGEIGDMRLHVMAALTLADDLAETKRKVAVLEAEVARLTLQAASGDERAVMIEERAAEAVQRTAERIERLARGLASGPASPGEA
jgi:cell division protein ZapA